MVDDVFSLINAQLDGTDYAIFGHSMGSLISYEVSHKLTQVYGMSPVHVFFSGRKPPNIEIKVKDYANMTDSEFLKEISKFGGLPGEILEERELVDMFLPALKSDFIMLGNYSYEEKSKGLESDITVLTGKDDNIPIFELLEWRKHTKKECKFYTFSGGHFFIFDDVENVSKVINGTLDKYI